ncbi:hypothetical protein C7T94_11310 [Pedobacter yulinensis]|uniref:Uncharacterized protein n=1 Tax=Pedobacter yulinensis TaxID=2126353 RepID=A0A2T3HL69_9SPHI|nr:hypothetical protein C7T94_11310 [Pedobacter yulinensis]
MNDPKRCLFIIQSSDIILFPFDFGRGPFRCSAWTAGPASYFMKADLAFGLVDQSTVALSDSHDDLPE